MSKVQAQAIIRGRVQGVWFRQSTLKTANGLGLTGWVRNLSDGAVEALFEGEAKAVEQMLDWCRSGPPLAKVNALEVTRRKVGELSLSGDPFEVRPTASSPETPGEPE